MPITNQQLSKALSSAGLLPIIKPLQVIKEQLKLEKPDDAVPIGMKRAIADFLNAFWLSIKNDPSKSYQQNHGAHPYEFYTTLAKLLATDEEVIQERLSEKLSEDMQMIISALGVEEGRQLLAHQSVYLKSYVHLLMPCVENTTDLYTQDLSECALHQLFYVDKHLYTLADLLQTFQMQRGFFLPHDANQLLPLELVLQCDQIMQRAHTGGLESYMLTLMKQMLNEVDAISVYRLERLINLLEPVCQAHVPGKLEVSGLAWPQFVEVFEADECYRALDKMTVNSEGLTIGTVFRRQQASFGDLDAVQQDLECLSTNAGLIRKALIGLKHLKEFSLQKQLRAKYKE